MKMPANLRLTAPRPARGLASRRRKHPWGMAFGALLAAAPLSAEETTTLKEVTVTASSDTVASGFTVRPLENNEKIAEQESGHVYK